MNTPAGWYADPSGKWYTRYWDGETWTARVGRSDEWTEDSTPVLGFPPPVVVDAPVIDEQARGVRRPGSPVRRKTDGPIPLRPLDISRTDETPGSPSRTQAVLTRLGCAALVVGVLGALIVLPVLGYRAGWFESEPTVTSGDGLGQAIDSGVEGLPVPSAANRDSDVGDETDRYYTLPSAIPYEDVVRWFTENLPAYETHRSWRWCERVSLPETATQWTWYRGQRDILSVIVTYDDPVVVNIGRDRSGPC